MALCALCAVVFATTMATSLSTAYFDSAEFVIGAHTLGIVHAPGYPLYLLIAHGFTRLPLGDVAFRVNVLSMLCLTLTAPLLYLTLAKLVCDRWVAATATLTTLFTYHVWLSGTAAEIYAPQLLALALVGVLMLRGGAHLVAVGGGVGLALAMAPASVLFVPGIVAVLNAQRAPLHKLLIAGVLAALVVVLSLLYFPLRYAAQPVFNTAGTYDGAGVFQPVDLQTLPGIWWMLRGAQFASFFNFVPTPAQAWELAAVLAADWLWAGIAVIAVGIFVLARTRRRLLLAWLALIVPALYFYAGYGAADKPTMLGGVHLLLGLPFAFGLRGLLGELPQWVRRGVMTVAVLVVLVVNYPAVRAHRTHDAYDQARVILAQLPPDAVVFGKWRDVLPLQYAQLVDGQRPDVTLHNLFFFSDDSFTEYMQYTAWEQPHPVLLLTPEGNTPAQDALLYFLELEPLTADEQTIAYQVIAYQDPF